MELLLVLVMALLLLKPSDAVHLARFFGRLFALKRKGHDYFHKLLDEALHHPEAKKNSPHDKKT